MALFWKSPNISFGWFSLMWGFTKWAWIATAVTILILYIMIISIKKLQKPIELNTDHWINSGIAISKAVLGNSFDEETLFPRKSSRSGSILMFCISLTGFILYSSYTSCLISLIAIKEVNIPFKSISELPQHSEFKIGTYSINF